MFCGFHESVCSSVSSCVPNVVTAVSEKVLDIFTKHSALLRFGTRMNTANFWVKRLKFKVTAGSYACMRYGSIVSGGIHIDIWALNPYYFMLLSCKFHVFSKLLAFSCKCVKHIQHQGQEMW